MKIILLLISLSLSCNFYFDDKSKQDDNIIYVPIQNNGNNQRDICNILEVNYSENKIQFFLPLDINIIEITINNLETCESWTKTIEEGQARVVIKPKTNIVNGNYSIEIITENGDIYTGEFQL